MPCATKETSSSTQMKPYDIPAASTMRSNRGPKLTPSPKAGSNANLDSMVKIEKDSKSSPSRAPYANRRWTKEELIQLYEHVIKNGPRKWEDAVEGRTVNQCQQTWGSRCSKTLHPSLKNAILSKGVQRQHIR